MSEQSKRIKFEPHEELSHVRYVFAKKKGKGSPWCKIGTCHAASTKLIKDNPAKYLHLVQFTA